MKKYYTNSDIFNSYIEIAEKRGLVKIAEDMESDKSKAILDKNPRADSLTKEKISKLYDLEIDTPKEMKYERNIVELAHPKPKYIHNSYDKINSLVENVNERQDIMLRIVNKRTSGAIAQHKYAQDEVVRALVRIANDMDNKDEAELRSLADECIEQLKKNAGIGDFFDDIAGIVTKGKTPEWLRPIASTIRVDIPVAIIAGTAAAIVGAPVFATIGAWSTVGMFVAPVISILAGLGPLVKHIHENCEVVLDEMDDFSEDMHGIEGKYLKELQDAVTKLKYASAEYYKEGASLLETHDENVGSDKDKEVAKELVKNPRIVELKRKLEDQVNICSPILGKFKYQYQGILSEYRKAHGFSDVRSRITDWFSPVVSALNPVLQLSDAVDSLISSINNFMKDGKDIEQRAKEFIDEVNEKAKKKYEEGKKEYEKGKETIKKKYEEAVGDEKGEKDDSSNLFADLLGIDLSDPEEKKIYDAITSGKKLDNDSTKLTPEDLKTLGLSTKPENQNSQLAAAAKRKIVNIIKNS